MKKILILDVDSCYFCPCSSAEVGWLGNITRSVCQATGEENTVFMDGVSGVPDWCPLKPMPKKINLEEQEDIDAEAYPNPYLADKIVESHGYKRHGCCNDVYCGWNACLNEITGERE